MTDKSEQRIWSDIEQNLEQAMEKCSTIASSSGDSTTSRQNEQIFKNLSEVRSNLEALKRYHPVSV